MPDLLLTYDEIADRLGTNRNAARVLVQRRGWKRTPGNDGRARVLVPEEALQEAREARAADPAGHGPPHDEAVLLGLRARLEDKDREIGRLEAELRRAHADVDHARSEVTRAREKMDRERRRTDEMTVQVRQSAEMLDQAHRDRVAAEVLLRQQVDHLRQDLNVARKPWWRRMNWSS